MFGPLIRKFVHAHGAQHAAQAALNCWSKHRFGGGMVVMTITEEAAVVRGTTDVDPQLYRRLSAALADHADTLDPGPVGRPNT